MGDKHTTPNHTREKFEMTPHYTFDLKFKQPGPRLEVRQGVATRISIKNAPIDKRASFVIGASHAGPVLLEQGGKSILLTPEELSLAGLVPGTEYVYSIWIGPPTDKSWVCSGTFAIAKYLEPVSWPGKEFSDEFTFEFT